MNSINRHHSPTKPIIRLSQACSFWTTLLPKKVAISHLMDNAKVSLSENIYVRGNHCAKCGRTCTPYEEHLIAQ